MTIVSLNDPSFKLTLSLNEATLLRKFFAKVGAPEIAKFNTGLTKEEIDELQQSVIYPIYDYLDDHSG